MNTLYADIILPFAVPGTFTYEVPEAGRELAIAGMRCEVHFRKKIQAGIILRIHQEKPSGFQPRQIIQFPDDEPVVSTLQLRLWIWMSTYYMCTLGEIYQAAVPALFKSGSETQISLNQMLDTDTLDLDDRSFILVEALKHQKVMQLKDVQELLGIKQIQSLLRKLVMNNVILLQEEVRDVYKPKVRKLIRLTERFQDEEALRQLFDELNRAVRQQHVLMIYLQLAPEGEAVSRGVLLKKAEASAAVLKAMTDKGIFEETEEVVSRLKLSGNSSLTRSKLSLTQQEALHSIRSQWQEKEVVLLHGVTGSGKTEIYMELIEEVLERGKQVLYLLPEIALTAQIIGRLQERFGDQVGIYHSRFNHQERVEIWQKVQQGSYRILLGARSALFLSFQDLGLVVIDEEHDYSFKQQDPAPRYHARDTAIYLASMVAAKVLLGSATPSVEAYQHAHTGKFGYVELTERFAGMELPEIELINMQSETQQNNVVTHFSRKLLAAMEEAVAGKEQVILFQNRRGYAPYVVCTSCGWTPVCVRCDVKLVYHKFSGELRCHYCGYKQEIVTACPECASTQIIVQGFGTEKVEDELQALYPAWRIARLDLDAVRTKAGHEKVIHAFEDGQVDVLIGTQMVTKGLDFDNVRLVGILSADQLLQFADFRAAERAYQLMMQVSGRAGRKQKRGKVLIQTLRLDHPVLGFVQRHETHTFYEEEIRQRRNFKYPPFNRIIRITLRHAEPGLSLNAAYGLVNALGNGPAFEVLGPVQPAIARIRGKYLSEVMIKVRNDGQSAKAAKQRLRQAMERVAAKKEWKKVEIIPDIDPV
ncbi:MAG TPA: primosomal protein N' [Bacteroidetes bacterium]|nr:primosomal protein N' [Bacteroidota bacterium]